MGLFCAQNQAGSKLKPTTAQALTTYRDELDEARFDPDVIDHLGMDAAHAIVRSQGLGVRSSDPLDAEDQPGNGFCISEDRKVINFLGENYYTREPGTAEFTYRPDTRVAVTVGGHEVPSPSAIVKTSFEEALAAFNSSIKR